MSTDPHLNGRESESLEVPEEERHLPVLASEARPIERAPQSPLPAPVVAATGGFLAGVATLLFVRFLRRSAGGRGRGIALRRSKRGDRSLEISGSRSFLVDVHMLKR